MGFNNLKRTYSFIILNSEELTQDELFEKIEQQILNISETVDKENEIFDFDEANNFFIN